MFPYYNKFYYIGFVLSFAFLVLTCSVSAHADDTRSIATRLSVVERANPNRYLHGRHRAAHQVALRFTIYEEKNMH